MPRSIIIMPPAALKESIVILKILKSKGPKKTKAIAVKKASRVAFSATNLTLKPFSYARRSIGIAVKGFKRKNI
jgi:hypothetical protein